MKELVKRLFLFGVFCFALGIGTNAYSGGIDLTRPNNNYGLVASISMQTGKVYGGIMYVVDNGHVLANDNTSAGDFRKPFSTLDYAIGRSSVDTSNGSTGGANRGDLILLMPGSTSTVTEAGGIDVDVAGLTIFSLGEGTDRHTVAFTTIETADIDIDAANVTLANMIFNSGTNTLNAPIDVNGDYFTMLNCVTRDRIAGIAGAVKWIDVDSDFVSISGLTHYGTPTANATYYLTADGADDFIMKDFNIYGNFSQAGLMFGTTTVCLRFDVNNGYIWTENSADKLGSSSATSTGRWGPNLYGRLQDNAANLTEAFIGDDAQFFLPIGLVNADGEASGTETTFMTISTDS